MEKSIWRCEDVPRSEDAIIDDRSMKCLAFERNPEEQEEPGDSHNDDTDVGSILSRDGEDWWQAEEYSNEDRPERGEDVDKKSEIGTQGHGSLV